MELKDFKKGLKFYTYRTTLRAILDIRIVREASYPL